MCALYLRPLAPTEKPVAHHIPNAVLDGDFEYLESIIYSHRDMVDYIGPAGFAAMHVAAYKKDMGMVDMLLKVSRSTTTRV